MYLGVSQAQAIIHLLPFFLNFVCIPSIVLHHDVYYCRKPDRGAVSIDLKSEIGESISEPACTVEELDSPSRVGF
jgi:hypothetical protein